MSEIHITADDEVRIVLHGGRLADIANLVALQALGKRGTFEGISAGTGAEDLPLWQAFRRG